MEKAADTDICMYLEIHFHDVCKYIELHFPSLQCCYYCFSVLSAVVIAILLYKQAKFRGVARGGSKGSDEPPFQS